MKHEVGDNVRKNIEVKSGLRLKLLFTSVGTVHGYAKKNIPTTENSSTRKELAGGEICLSASFLPKQGIEIKWQDQYLHR